MKLKDISRTATFAWDQSSSSSPLIATGAVAGALDESFSNESQLDIWAPEFNGAQPMSLGTEGNGPLGSVTVGSRFNRLAWSTPSAAHGRGVLAAGLETGELVAFDPEKIIAGASADAARIFSHSKHTGPIRGLDFNPIQKNLLLSGAVNAELYIYDLNNPTNPIAPGNVSTKLGEITSLQWNPTVSRVFAASSSSGFTSVWDLKAQKEIVSLQYGGGAAKGMDTVGGVAGLQMGKRRGMSDVCWHPEQATRLITASEDDESPIIMLWDLRNTRAPERILSGHHKGVLSVSWCRQDADLLLSCGKDNRTLCWNPQTGEIIGELPVTSDWSFQTSWCPRNPDLLATASFDGHISINSLQTTHVPEKEAPSFVENATADDVFSTLGQHSPSESNANVLSLKQPPKWLRRPVSASFGFGGLLATTSNLPGASGKHQSGVVHLRQIVTEEGIVDRAKALEETAGDRDKLEEFCNARVTDKSETAWKTIQKLFKANSKEELVELLGFSKEEVAKQVKDATSKFPEYKPEDATKSPAEVDGEDEPTTPTKAPSEISTTSARAKGAQLFDDAPGTPSAATDFFSSMTASSLRNRQLDNIVSHTPDVPESSVGATVGSTASSIRSEVIKDSNTFQIYPSGESDVDRLITQALVLGDFASAVDLCLASERFADALLLAVRGGPELLQSTQKAYFARRTVSLPFLRVFQSIVTEDLADIVQNAELNEWKVIFVVICTFSKDGDFNNLADQLGQRLAYKAQVLAQSDSLESKTGAKTAREDATFCFLAARRLEKVVSIWVQELKEEEGSSSAPRYTAHAQALQSFVEKVAVFTAATNYVDEDLATPTENAAAAEAGARTYRLASLYDRYYEYADLLATQGLVDAAAKYVNKTPSDYKGSATGPGGLDKARDRLFRAAGLAGTQSSSSTAFASASQPRTQARLGRGAAASASAYAPAPNTSSAYAPAPAAQSHYAPTPAAPTASVYAHPAPASQSGPYAPAPSSYAPSQPASQPYGNAGPYAPQQSYQPSTSLPYAPPVSNGYGLDPQPQGYGAPSNPYGAPAAHTPLAPPPRTGGVIHDSSSSPPIVPASQRRDMPGWNDAPSLVPPKRPASTVKETPKPAPIMSPFPQSHDAPSPAFPQQGGVAAAAAVPPPPRSSQPGMLPPPPKGGPRPMSAQAIARNAAAAAAAQQQSLSPPPAHARDSPAQIPGPQPPHAAGPPPRASSRGGPPPGVIAGPPPRALSPLGPGRQQQPLGLVGQLQTPATPVLNHQPQRAFVPSPPVAGPSPGGRAGLPPQGRVPSIPPITSPGPEPVATPPAPAKPTHPAGDRSHIPPSSKSIYDTLSAELARVQRTTLPPAIKRIADDTERRLNILFDQLNNDAVPQPALDKLASIAKALAAKDPNQALALHVDLLTHSTGATTAWIPGVKQLIRLGV